MFKWELGPGLCGGRWLLGWVQPSGSSISAVSDSVHFASPGGQHQLQEDAWSGVCR